MESATPSLFGDARARDPAWGLTFRPIEHNLSRGLPGRCEAHLTGRESKEVRLDPLLQTRVNLTDEEFRQLVDFIRNGLLDPRAKPEKLRNLIPSRVPSGRPLQIFQLPSR